MKAWSTVRTIRAQFTRTAISRGFVSGRVDKVSMVIRLLGPVVADSIEQVEARALIPSAFIEWVRGGCGFATGIFDTGQ